MRRTREQPTGDDGVDPRAVDVSTPTPPLASEDQHSFNESLRAGVRGLGGLVRGRKRRNVQPAE